MKTASRLVAVLLVSLCGFSQAESIDFRPIKAVANGDGTAQPITLFKQGAGYVSLRVPRTWKVTGGAGEATFSKLNTAQTTAVWRPYAGKINFSDPKKSVISMRQLALSSAPATATHVVVTSEASPGTSMKGMQALEVEISFTFYGNFVRRSVMIFEEAPGVQYSLVITANASDFDQIHNEGLTLLNSWWTVTPDDLDGVKLLQ